MGQFNDVFNGQSIYETLFINIKSVLIYPTLEKLKEQNKSLHDRWIDLAKTKYNESGVHEILSQEMYENKGIYYPEFTKIVAITYATLYLEKGTIKRFFKKIVDNNEEIVIETFMDVLHQISSEGIQSNPQYFPTLCGYNIIANDIPLLVKRFLIHKNKFKTNQKLPFILKRVLDIKPWESGVLDVLNVWKFNGFMNSNLMLMSDYMGLKKTTDLLSPIELSKYYWNNIEENPEETLELFALQSATQTNLVIQLMNELRQL